MSRTRADAEQSGIVVQDAVTPMSEIEKSSRQISQILGVIDEIAFQTNLLALNETESLATLTSHFRLGQDTTPTRKPARAPSRPAPQSTRGNQALTLVSASANQDWQEF